MRELIGPGHQADVNDDPKADAVDRSDPQEPSRFDGPPSQAGRLDVFISYARRPVDRQFVDWLADRLTERGKKVWLDRSSIAPGADWRQRIERGIEAATSVIVVITPDSTRSPECANEIEAALKANKRIVPIVLRAPRVEDLAPELTRFNWVDCQDVERYEEALDEVFEALESDLDWRDAHARLTTRAREWATSGRDRSFLLRGRDLRAAEDWYGEKDQHAEQPTDEQYRFIAAGRRSATRRQRGLLVALAMGLIVSLGAGAVALIQRQNAIAQRQAAITEAGRAQSDQMALQAQTLFPTNTPAGILVALAAYERYPTTAARSALAQAAATRLRGILSVPVGAFAYSPDGRTFATGDANGLVSVWDAATRRRLWTRNDGSFVNWLAFSPDGRTVATGDNNGRAVVWSVRNGARKTSLVAGSQVDSLAFSPHGRLLATGTWNGLVALWDLTSRRRIWEHASRGATAAGGANVAAEAFSPDGSILASGDTHSDVTLWNVARGTKRSAWNDGNWVWSLAFGPNGKTLATGTNGGGVVLWNVARATKEVLDPGSDVTSVAVSPDGNLLAAGDYGGNVTLWGIPSGVKAAAFNDGGSFVAPVAFSPDGKTLASIAAKQGTIVFWDVSVFDDRGITAPPVFSPDGRLLVTGDGEGLTLWDAATGAAVTRLSVPAGVTSLAFRPDGRSIALADGHGHLMLWNVVTHRELTIGKDPAVFTLDFSPNGRTLAEGNTNGRVMLWDVSTRRKRYLTAPGGGQVFDLAFSPDSRTLAIPEASASSGRVTLKSVATDKTERSWNWRSPVNQVVFRPDGQMLAVGDQGGRVTLLNVQRGSTAATWNDGNIVGGLAFSRDGRTLAVGDAANKVTLWDLTSDAKTASTPGGAGGPEVAFSPDGHTLAVNIGTADILYPTAIWDGGGATIKPLLCRELTGFNLTREQWRSYSADGSYQRPCR
jgi:WD40 repeat protein